MLPAYRVVLATTQRPDYAAASRDVRADCTHTP